MKGSQDQTGSNLGQAKLPTVYSALGDIFQVCETPERFPLTIRSSLHSGRH